MKRICPIVVCIFLTSVAPALAQPEVVAAVKRDLEARHVSLMGSCGAFEITKRVAWILRTQGYGLLSKPGGNNCQGYAVDYLTRMDGSGVDLLGDSGGENIPAFSESEPPGALTGRWREPFDPGDQAAPAPPLPSNSELQELLKRLQEVLVDTAYLKTYVQGLNDQWVAHEAAEATERARAEEFRQTVGHEYQKALSFAGKFIVPALLAFFGGRAL